MSKIFFKFQKSVFFLYCFLLFFYYYFREKKIQKKTELFSQKKYIYKIEKNSIVIF